MGDSIETIQRACQDSQRRSMERRYDSNVRSYWKWRIALVLLVAALGGLVAWALTYWI